MSSMSSSTQRAALQLLQYEDLRLACTAEEAKETARYQAAAILAASAASLAIHLLTASLLAATSSFFLAAGGGLYLAHRFHTHEYQKISDGLSQAGFQAFLMTIRESIHIGNIKPLFSSYNQFLERETIFERRPVEESSGR